jgi:hypothetical protein
LSQSARASKNLAAKKSLKSGAENQTPASSLSQLLRSCFDPLRNPLTLVNASAISPAWECVLVASTVI